MFRELRWARALRVEVPEELRGWRWDSPPVMPPPSSYRVSVSDVANGHCPTKKSAYLRRVLRVEAKPTPPMRFGSYIHAVFKRTLAALRRLIEDGVSSGWELLQAFRAEAVAEEAAAEAEFEADPRGAAFARYLAVQTAARLDEVASRAHGRDPLSLAARVVPVLAEYQIDGRPLGLTIVRADALAHDVVVEIKVGDPGDYELVLAGYALAIEADEEIPVDRGLLLNVSFNGGVKARAVPVAIGESLRRRFLEERDALLELLDSGRDPGVAPSCQEKCPFFHVCHGGGGS